MKISKLFFAFFSFTFLSFGATSQEIETVIASGVHMNLYAAISPDNKFIAESSGTSVIIWDFRSGRMIREILVPGVNITGIEFYSEKNTVMLSLIHSNDKRIVNFETGVITKVSGPKLDWATFIAPESFLMTHHIALNKPDCSISSPSPNGKYEVIFKRESVKTQFDPLHIYLKKDGKISGSLGTVLTGIPYFAFSNDSRYLFTNNFIYDFELERKICELKTVQFSGMGTGCHPVSGLPVTNGINEIITWTLPKPEAISMQTLVGMNQTNNLDFLVYRQINEETFRQELVVYNLLLKQKHEGSIGLTRTHEAFEDLSMDSEHLVTSSHDSTYSNYNSYRYSIYNSRSGKLVKEFTNSVSFTDAAYPTKIFFLNNEEIILYHAKGEKNYFKKINFITNIEDQMTFEGLSGKGDEMLVFMKTDGQFMFGTTSYLKQTSFVWDIMTGKIICRIATDKALATFTDFCVSHDHKFAVLSNIDGSIQVYNLKNGILVHSFIGHKGMVWSSSISKDNKRLITGSADGTCRIWDLERGVELASIISTGKNDFAIITPQHYYFATKGAADKIHFVKGVDIYTFEQFDLKYNRPDLVLSQLGYYDITLIEAYHKAYLKRLTKMNFTEEMLQADFHLPEIKIDNIESISTIVNSAELALDISMSDSRFNLDRINLWVNGVNIYGNDGKNLREQNLKNFKTSLIVPLAFGENKIEVSVLNSAGAESYKETIFVESSAGKQQPDLYVLSIGVSNYQDARYNLNYAAKDAVDITRTFESSDYFTKFYSKTLTNEEVKIENVFLLKSFFENADINDQVVVFIAGHGVLDVNFDYYFASYDMNFSNPSERGIPYEMLEKLLDGIKPLKKLLFMDTCHSGEVDKDEIVLSDNNSTEKDDNIVFRNVGVAVENKENTLGLSNTSELMKSLFNDLRKGTGTTVISSSGGVEFAMESDEWKNGLFTFCLIDGLVNKKADIDLDGEITLFEIQNYVQTQVNALSGGRQTPTSRIQNNELNYRVW